MIVAICKAYTDFRLDVTISDLADWGLYSGEVAHWPREKLLQTINQHRDKGVFMPGGPIPNTLAQLSFLGTDTGFVGKLSSDELSNMFTADLRERNISYQTPIEKTSELGSALVLVLVDETGERTILWDRGIADYLSISDIQANQSLIQQAHILCISEILRETVNHEKLEMILSYIDENVTVVTALQSYNESTPEEQTVNILSHADIIFGNEAEYQVFIDHSRQDDLKGLSHLYPNKIFVRTLADKGAQAWSTGGVTNVSSDPVSNIVDTIGAGDAFMGGFLHDWSKNQNIEAALKLGVNCARAILQVPGGKPKLKH